MQAHPVCCISEEYCSSLMTPQLSLWLLCLLLSVLQVNSPFPVKAGAVEQYKRAFARQRARDLAQHADTLLYKDKEIAALQQECRELQTGLGQGKVRHAVQHHSSDPATTSCSLHTPPAQVMSSLPPSGPFEHYTEVGAGISVWFVRVLWWCSHPCLLG